MKYLSAVILVLTLFANSAVAGQPSKPQGIDLRVDNYAKANADATAIAKGGSVGDVIVSPTQNVTVNPVIQSPDVKTDIQLGDVYVEDKNYVDIRDYDYNTFNLDSQFTAGDNTQQLTTGDTNLYNFALSFVDPTQESVDGVTRPVVTWGVSAMTDGHGNDAIGISLSGGLFGRVKGSDIDNALSHRSLMHTQEIAFMQERITDLEGADSARQEALALQQQLNIALADKEKAQKDLQNEKGYSYNLQERLRQYEPECECDR